MVKMEIQVDKCINSTEWGYYSEAIQDSCMAKIVRAAIEGSDYSSCFDEVEISMVFTDNKEIQEINSKFRGKNKPTNIISMQVEEFIKYEKREYVFLGDLVFSIETIQEEAQEEQKTFIDHLSHLIVHGVLHLLGYNHRDDEEQVIMESKEIEILQTLGISSPYKG